MSDYKLVYDDGGDYIERIKDGKKVATVTDEGIKPTAPAYYKNMDDLVACVEAAEGEPAEEEPAPPVVAESPQEEVAEEDPQTTLEDSDPPETDRLLGDRTPAYIEWFHANHGKEEFEKRYRGRLNSEVYRDLYEKY